MFHRTQNVPSLLQQQFLQPAISSNFCFGEKPSPVLRKVLNITIHINCIKYCKQKWKIIHASTPEFIPSKRINSILSELLIFNILTVSSINNPHESSSRQNCNGGTVHCSGTPIGFHKENNQLRYLLYGCGLVKYVATSHKRNKSNLIAIARCSR